MLILSVEHLLFINMNKLQRKKRILDPKLYTTKNLKIFTDKFAISNVYVCEEERERENAFSVT